MERTLESKQLTWVSSSFIWFVKPQSETINVEPACELIWVETHLTFAVPLLRMLQLSTTTLRTSRWLCVRSLGSRQKKKKKKKRERDFCINTAALWSPSPLWHHLDRRTVCVSNSLHFLSWNTSCMNYQSTGTFLFPLDRMWIMSSVSQKFGLFKLKISTSAEGIRYWISRFPHWSPPPLLTVKSFISFPWCNEEPST